MAETKSEKKSGNKLVLGAAIVVTFIVGLVIGVFIGPSILFHHAGGPGGYSAHPMIPANKTYAHYNYSVNIAYLPGIGNYLVNQTGWALYMYVPDTPNSGKSTCYGECAVAWPIFHPPANFTIQPGINASMFSTINRTDGTKEVTFNGYPLYYYEYDTGAGNVNGQNVGGIWYVMSPSGAVIRNNTS